MNFNDEKELDKAISKEWNNKVSKIIDFYVKENNKSILEYLFFKLKDKSIYSNGAILSTLVKGFFRLKRTSKDELYSFIRIMGYRGSYC
ncbi:hypothetical protein [Flammeovirga aprica]|uniref:Uncharacterized protein n=1 Tax=Flammeovirga aprica JL-4 TaxID=694437 RepID=A0A7X9P3M8_9BACT|nr:hypothetical protein [Flammeovirga aprica]NME68497.1 hypothetical protein [Flammeovirga aprica JL-4]